ncbi:MAG: SDR family NAD(P)-dependent oxidoreductase [Gammaproteobacteria bacterium]|nr:SDR family NAD(P)-dependent oxidoreductase [Gammaproteobacteria bacterium]
MRDVAGKVAFVTGGASGIGLAMVRSFCAADMKVAIADIEKRALDAAVASFAHSNAHVIGLRVDVTDRDAMAHAADETERAFGKVHVVCNNAGVGIAGPIEEVSYDDWDWVMGVNLHGVINGVQTFVPRIVAHGEGGHIVNTASLAGHVAVPGLSVYNTTKFAVVGLSETMRAELASQNISVSVLCPGFVDTNIFTSERNRPDALRVQPGSDPQPMNLEAYAKFLDGMLDPSIVGDMTLHAIQQDEAYIFTHPDIAAGASGRMESIQASVALWRQYLDERGIS